MILSLITFALGSIGRYVVGGLIVAALLGGFVLKIRHDAVRSERIRVEEINRDAIEKANAARDAVRAACDINPSACVRSDEFRD